MPTRREFFKTVALLSGGAGVASALLPSIEKAAAIDPPEGSTYLDAEHVVILMQENRSFDHCFGTLRGVRGFNDPRAVTLPDGNPVWLQTNAAGETYAPFRLNIKETNATWLGSLPHSWTDQQDARNHGNHDKWLDAKPSGHEGCAGVPLTLGYYTREDIPYYYALADAFTVCDQHFCSSLTGTTPNRLYLWTGTIRQEQHSGSPANVRNSDVDFDIPVSWTTFPERLEKAAISWKIYQNELSLASGLSEEEDSWLSNFSDNPIEWFTQYHGKFFAGYRTYLQQQPDSLPAEIEGLRERIKSSANAAESTKLQKELQEKEQFLRKIPQELATWTPENFEKLPQWNRDLHAKAFTTNKSDPDYRRLATLHYRDGEAERQLQIPKGDVLHQFREDVTSDNLPTVSWIVAPEKFSDHPSAPWYGAWLLAETLNILTDNPEVWKKTIFILTYDENDGYFDHVPPFVAPQPGKPETGLTSAGIDAEVEYVTLEQDLTRAPQDKARGGSIGLGYRVPLVIASPWSRGGAVCSQVFDHTSVLQFLEKWASHRSGKQIRETNISAWRRAVCGDLSSAFTAAKADRTAALSFPQKDSFIEGVHKAQFAKFPSGYRKLSSEEIAEFRRDSSASPFMPRQEKGVRPSRALPYQLYVDGRLSRDRRSVELTFEASDKTFGAQSAGAPFHVYVPGGNKIRSYAVAAGRRVTSAWAIDDFVDGVYRLRAHGPNGFFREFAGGFDDPLVEIRCEYTLAGDVELFLANAHSDDPYTFRITDHSAIVVPPLGHQSVILNLGQSFHWYDFNVTVAESKNFTRRYAGRVETGSAGFSDPAMGQADLAQHPL